MSFHFESLMGALGASGADHAPPFVHGALTGIALAFDSMQRRPWLQTLSGSVPAAALERLAAAAVEEIGGTLRHGSFEPLAEGAAERRQWCEGYIHMVGLDNDAWRDFHESHPAIAALYPLVVLLARPDVYAELAPADAPSYQEIISERGAHLGPVIRELYLWRFAEPESVEFCGGNPVADWPLEALRHLSDGELLARMRDFSDRLARTFVDECVRRGPAMAALLGTHIDRDRHWSEAVDDGDWWALLHAAHILGAMPGEEAAAALLRLMERMESAPDNNLWDWLAPHWPQLFQNKRQAAAPRLEAIAFDGGREKYLRHHALEALLEAAHASGAAPLNAMLDRLAAIAAEPEEDETLRGLTGGLLLDFPRPRHRPLLDTLADEFERTMEWGVPFDRAYVAHRYEEGVDRPDWQRFDHFLHFYAPLAILGRQVRWIEEDARHHGALESLEPFIRATPKVGRNDPCPCGSGKKYKKCCMAVH